MPSKSKPKPNAELLAGCARGEAEAWDETVDRFGALVWTVARSHRVSPAEAEDVRQLTWFRLMQNVDRIRDPDRLGDWLATVARREAIKAATRARRLVMVGDSETLEHLVDRRAGHHESPEQITLRADHARELRRAIDTLSPQCRDVLRHALQDPPPSYQDLATALSVPVGSIGPIRTRCLRRLRRALEHTAPRTDPPPPTPGCADCPAGRPDGSEVPR
ncbi:RNA polymerase sigma factor [Streptomyces sp. NPDC001595]|uniref:RNA polymerase sigma factor n=1 Tax=Streptomyces sp. NPDC001532 TaxID=3154520 RepID=UPI003332EFC7